MRGLALLACWALAIPAQDGAEVFRATCAQGYCHGAAGTQGRAPRLIGRNYDPAFVVKVVSEGVPNTGMPGFRNSLDTARLNAVIAYVVRISGGDLSKLPAAAGGSAPSVPADVKRGRELFQDAVRGFQRCNTCHVMEGMGTPVGPNAAGSHDVESIRNGKPAAVRRAIVKPGDSFAALTVETKQDWVKLYDLSALPPVLRTLRKADLSFADGADWRHSKVVANYTDAELASIAAYLRWAASH